MDDEIPRGKSWRAIRGQRPLNEERMAMYGRLMDAEARLDDVRRRHGVSDTALGDALALSEAESSRASEDVFLSTLARYVSALGGQLELRAVFPEETVTLLQVPDEPSGR
jgi:hypothetical protein